MARVIKGDGSIHDFLLRTGHLEYAHGTKQVLTGPFSSAISTAEVLKAVASFQEFEAERMDRLCLKHHSRPARFDGEIGPATLEAMNVPRCGHPDYGPDKTGRMVAAATGTGSWEGCHGIGKFHCAKVYINESGMPSFLAPVFPRVWGRAANSFDDMGLAYQRTEERGRGNTEVSFVSRSNGWIGLAIVGQQQSCTSQIWAKFLATYHPNNVLNEWTSLLMHELAHNAGCDHTRGGIMNPSIIEGLAPTWRGDPSEPILTKYYGGVPVTGGKPDKEYWTYQGLKSNKGQVQWVPLAVPFSVED